MSLLSDEIKARKAGLTVLSQKDIDIFRMLGKRKAAAWRKPPPKKKKKFTTKFAGAPGYDPKAQISHRRPPGAELKVHQIGVDATSFTVLGDANNATYAHIPSLNLIEQGDGQSSREGNRITIDKLTLRVQTIVDKNSNATFANLQSANNTHRIIVYVDTQTNGSALGYDQLLDANPNNDFQFASFNNLVETGRFKILADKFLQNPVPEVFFAEDEYHCAGSIANWKKTWTNMNLDIRYGDTTSNMSSVRTNNIGMFILTDAEELTQHKYRYRARVRFYDY